MMSDIKKFYNKIKLKKVIDDNSEEIPHAYIHVFHKEYPRLPLIKLPQIDNQESELENLLEIRESTRNFSDKPVKINELSKILRSCRIVDIDRIPERRTYPSGGARFPVELYVVAFNVNGLKNGAYHYNLKKESLELLWEEDLKNRRRELISPYLENPAATLVLTSVISRSEKKYGNRAYPYSLIEAGHMGQNIHLTCVNLGIGSCPVSGFVDNSVKEILDLTGDEIPIYTISIGWKKRFL